MTTRDRQNARLWPAGAHPVRYITVVELPQISDTDWQTMTQTRRPRSWRRRGRDWINGFR